MIQAGPALGALAGAGTTLRVLGAAGLVRPYRPSTLLRMGHALLQWGTGPAGGFATLAVRAPDAIGVVDDLGELTWGEVHRRANSLARGLAEHGVAEGHSVAIMCRNHRGFVEATIAVARLGADVVYLNTSFARPQVVGVLERESPSLVIHDEEFTEVLAGVEAGRVLAWTDGAGEEETIERLVSCHDDSDLHPPGRHSRIIILTSGTTGTPKGAPRREAGIDVAVALLSRIPLRASWRTHIAAPMFHTWGFAHLGLAMLLGSTVVLRRTFDPVSALRTVEEHRCQSLAVVPVMLQRMLAVDPDVLDTFELDDLRVVASSGSALPATLACAWMDQFGDNLYSLYGSTEVAYASVATPEDLRAAPTSAGRPPHGTVVRILDEEGHEVAQGQTGRIFVGNSLLFDGYTDGGTKEVVDGLMSTGDLGRFDEHGRLHVAGREDDMIVSGGENVFPQEVEDCLVAHPGVAEVAAIGVVDDSFGTRLRAFVVRAGDVTSEVTGAELKKHVRNRLAGFKVPREIVFVDEIPRNATGKIMRRELSHWEDA